MIITDLVIFRMKRYHFIIFHQTRCMNLNLCFIVSKISCRYAKFLLHTYFIKDYLSKSLRYCSAKSFYFPTGNYMVKVNNRKTRARCEICSKLAMKTPKLCRCPASIFQNIAFQVLICGKVLLATSPLLPR